MGVTPAVGALKKTYVSFDYYMEGSSFLQVFVFDQTVGDNNKFSVHGPVRGKWAKATLKVSNLLLRRGHRINEMHFFAGNPGDKTTRLLVDNVRLFGRDK